jgi:Fur family transcriptional regulator, ferric uptake regulator
VCISRYSGSVAPPSPIRDRVRLLFATPGRHVWSTEELHEAVRASLGGADYSSVFRAVAGMEREGLIDRIDLADGKAHYELRDKHHDHVRCDSCGRVVGVTGCILENATSAVESDTGFKITSHQLLFTGLCSDCASGTSRRRGRATKKSAVA